MKKIPVTVQVNIPETLSEAIAMYGADNVYMEFVTALHLRMIQRMHAAGKIRYEK